MAESPSLLTTTRPEIELLLDSARVCLVGEDAQRLRDRLRRDLDWAYLLHMARRNGLVPLLFRHLDAAGPGVVPQQVLDQLRQSFHQNSLRNLFMTRQLFKLLDLLGAHGIEAIPYKGPTLAALAYGNLAFREFGDLDLLLHEHDIPRARDLLVAHGFRPGYKLTRAQEAASLEVTKQLHLVSGDGLLVELHSGITYRDFGFALDPECLWERLEPVSLVGREVFTFSPEDLLLILCVHGAKHCWVSLGWICDISEFISRKGGRIKWDALLEQARVLHSERVLLLGLALVGGLLRAPLPEGIATRIRAEPVIPMLVAQVRRWLFREADGLPGGLERTLFLLHARERLRDGVRFCLSLALVPRISDWEILSLPSSLSFVYFLIRPIRLANKYGLRRAAARRRP